MTIGSSLLSTLTAFAAMLLGLAIAVQVVQEMWKYVSSSRDKAYAAVLHDFLGPFLSRQLERPGVLRDLQVRGPFQFLWWRPSGKLLPMDADELVAALERTTGEWFQRAYAAIRLEVSLQRGTPARPSASWEAFMREVTTAHEAGTNAHATDIFTFLSAWPRQSSLDDKQGSVDAAGLLVAFHHQFLPQARKVGEHFDQLMRNYDFSYRRRNLRQTVVIALLLAIAFDLPAGKLYDRAATMSPEAAVELAQMATQLHDEVAGEPATSPADTLATLKDLANRALAIAGGQNDPFGKMTWPPVVWGSITRGDWGKTGRYLFQCFLTAVLICFGAPLLNDVTKTLVRAREGGVRGVTTGEFIERTPITAPGASPDRRS